MLSDVDSIVSEHRDNKLVAYTTWLTLLLVPVYSVTNTSIWYGDTKKTIWLWAWMGILKYKADAKYDFSEQVTVIGFPWVYILHIPTYYLIKQSWEIYKDDIERVTKAVYGISAILIQTLLIYMTFHSQDLTLQLHETVVAYYFPQWILLIVYTVFSFKWYTQQSKKALATINEKKTEPTTEGSA